MKTTWLLILGLASTGMAQNDEVFRAQKKLEAAADQVKANVMFNQQTFNFVAGQLISGPPVKGAPYSGEAVNETVQTLADGNRIVRRTTAMQYRDNDGRERREETSAMGAIFITDPVAGARYTLHPESRSAEKGPLPVLRISPSVAGNVFAYSNSEPLRLKGTVSAMDWINPTAWITLSFKGPDGGTANWKCATAGPNALLKLGWTRNSVKTGDTVTINGSRADGENTCVADSVVLSDGTTLTARAGAPAEIGAGGRGPVTIAVGRGVAGGRGGAPATELYLNGAPLTLVTGGSVSTGSGGAKNVKTEQLGKMYIEGVQAEGTRTTTTIPAGDIGNERPINIVDERWYSPDLQMTVMTKHSDPRAGETNFSLKNINLSSPPPYLFEVPSDYTVSAGGRGGGRSGGPVPAAIRVPEPKK